MSEEIRNAINDEDLEAVTGGSVTLRGNPAEYDDPADVQPVFAVGEFARVDGLCKRTKILSQKVAFNEETQKYGILCTCKDNAGKIEEIWEFNLSRTTL